LQKRLRNFLRIKTDISGCIWPWWNELQCSKRWH